MIGSSISEYPSDSTIVIISLSTLRRSRAVSKMIRVPLACKSYDSSISKSLVAEAGFEPAIYAVQVHRGRPSSSTPLYIFCRGSRIRTDDLFIPNEARYRASLHPDWYLIYSFSLCFNTSFYKFRVLYRFRSGDLRYHKPTLSQLS